MRYLGIKSTAHFRQGFESWAGAIYVVSEPSAHDPAGGNIHFRKQSRKLYPFHDM